MMSVTVKIPFWHFGNIFVRDHIVRTIPIALTGFPNLTGFLNEFESLIVN